MFLYENNEWKIGEFKNDMPRLALVQDYAVVSGRNRIFDALSAAAFDPEKQVILEKEPEPRPAISESKGAAAIIDSSTDHLTIEAELDQPAILLITDNYSEGWRAVALPGSVQHQYEVLPANYVLRAIPLSAGKHRLRMEYSPLAFRVGAWISIASLLAYLSLTGWFLWRWRCSEQTVASPSWSANAKYPLEEKKAP